MPSLVAALAAVFLATTAQTSKVQNLTVYRITPHNYTGVLNMNTGDAAGDAYFSLYEMIFPLYCSEEKRDTSCTARGILNIPNFDIFERSVIEVDTRYGVYSGCVPNPDTGIFECQPYARSSECWWNVTGPDGRNMSDFDGICSRSECYCAQILNASVGIFNKPMGQWPVRWHNQTAMWEQIEIMSDKLNGNWYSTVAHGQCEENQSPGNGKCWWKFHGVNKRINATCHRNKFQASIVSKNQQCFKRLPQPENVSAIPWSECLLATITGKSIGAGIPASPEGVSRDEIVTSFTTPFLSESEGGCPDWRE